MRWSEAQLQDYQARRRVADPNVMVKDATPVKRESELHEKIMVWCYMQWPKRKFIHARMDQRSTIDVGAQDFTIFLPQGKVLCVECKRKGGKRTPEQLAWAMQMEQLGHKVHCLDSYEAFLELVK